MLINPQFIFFGYPSFLLWGSEYRLKSLVDTWIDEILHDFDYILILEELDLSLAVMAMKLCWSIDDVAHLKVGNSTNNTFKTRMNSLG